MLLLVLGAYFAETFVEGFQQRAFGRERLTRLALLGLSPLALLVNPHGWRLLAVPFRDLSIASTYIKELERPVLSELLSVSLYRGRVSVHGLVAILLVVTALLLVRGLRGRTLRLSHLLLVAGGLLSSFFQSTGARPAYPFSSGKIFPGITAFLRENDLVGKVLNHPNWGGSLAWELYPRYRIAGDFQSPFLFDEEDTYLGMKAFFEAGCFERWVETYQPDFLVVPYEARRFDEIAAGYPYYKQILFDDAVVLYVDERKHPALVEKYSLGELDPFSLATQPVGPLRPEVADRLLPTVERGARFDPRGRRVNQLLFAEGSNRRLYVGLGQVLARRCSKGSMSSRERPRSRSSSFWQQFPTTRAAMRRGASTGALPSGGPAASRSTLQQSALQRGERV